MTHTTTPIRSLFDPGKNISRAIEKVITYGASQETRLKSEISEYVVTDGIEEQFRKLLDRMQLAMDTGGENEIGVWVSGFYGSGKSSFTKYLGLAFDNQVVLDGTPFLEHLQDRMHTPQARALLSTVVKKYPAAVVMLDLASEMLAGATMEDVSTVLYYKVLQWAGYSRNLKVAALERRLEKDGRHLEFLEKVEEQAEMTWETVQNDPLVVDSIVPEIAHQMYPNLFPTEKAFRSSTDGIFQFENERVREMIQLIREKSGKEHVIFIVDEVGQYVASRDNLILNLDGLAKNLKQLGDGKVWIISTAQQTLTEDNSKAALNSDKLYKLKDRFPIQIHLESGDIKEICYRRLLGKSPLGEKELAQIFEQNGQALRHNTKLQDAKYYEADFSKENFINLYPFLPAHFDILLHLLGALAKSTGGIGLRSAIKVIQEILVENTPEQKAIADQHIGWLATTVTLYNALDKDIRRAFPSIHQAVNQVHKRFFGSETHLNVAKSIAVLQILGNLPVTVQNVSSLMHPSVNAPSQFAAVKQAVDEMLNDIFVPLGTKEGNLTFLSEKLRDIEQERSEIALRSVEIRRILNEALRKVFDPLPKVTLNGNMTVASGLKVQLGNTATSLAGERDTIQTLVEMVDPTQSSAARDRLSVESRSLANRHNIYLLSRTMTELDALAGDIYRCQEIANLHQKDPDQEIKEYCKGQIGRAEQLATELQSKIKQALQDGSFIFKGQVTAVTSLDVDLQKAAVKHLSEVAVQVYDRNNEASVRVQTDLAEKVLRIGNPAAINSALDPLGLVEMNGGKASFRTTHKAILSIKDSIERTGSVDGKRLLDHFAEAPFGWSQDTTRYILAVMLMASEIKLKVSGKEVTVAGQHAIDALKTNMAFKNVGISLRNDKPSMDTLARAAERLTELVGDTVIPLEQDISKAAAKHFPGYQSTFAPLSEKLLNLDVAGSERLQNLSKDLADVLSTDASDAPQRLGAENSTLYSNLKWASELKRALDLGLDSTLKDLHAHRREILSLPETGVPGELRKLVAPDLDWLAQRLQTQDFYKHTADFNSMLTNIKARVRDAVGHLRQEQEERLKDGGAELQALEEWLEFTLEEQSSQLAQLEQYLITVPENLSGLKTLLSKRAELLDSLQGAKKAIQLEGHKRLLERLKPEADPDPEVKTPVKLSRTVKVPSRITSVGRINALLKELQELKTQLSHYGEIDLTFELDPSGEG